LAVATGVEPTKAVSLIESNTYQDYYESLGKEPEKLQQAIAASWDQIWEAAAEEARKKGRGK